MTPSRRWRVALASAASAAMLIAAPLVGGQAAYAQPYPPSPPLTISSTTVTAGGPLSFSTSPGVFGPGQGVTAELESKPIILGHFWAQPDGSVAGTVTIPTTAPNGWHTFRLTSDHPDPSVAASIYVTGGLEPSPTPTPTPTRPGHHHGDDEHGHDGHDDDPGVPGGPGGHPGSGDHVHHPDGVRPGHQHLAETGSAKTLALGGASAALLAAGGGTMLAMRRRRNS